MKKKILLNNIVKRMVEMENYEFMEQRMALKLIKAVRLSSNGLVHPEQKEVIDLSIDDLYKMIAFADECLNTNRSKEWTMLTKLVLKADFFSNVDDFLNELEKWKKYYENKA